MYRDIVMDEIEKTGLIIARIFGIKVDRTHQEYKKEFEKAIGNEYKTELETILALNQDEFEDLIKSDKYSSAKLNALSQILYVFAEPFKDDEATQALLKKVMAIFDVLEQKYRFQTFDNITKRNAIYKYFNIS
ncbi:hypothetical protein ACFQZS_15355 [Mucilaginibacter calamicampi]|uniref:Uncharacterized protein n=1 Tax=Mucilaginibacter calamicampi TaxID=1302352 RepID=A0ABW2Z081_9SPHI